MSNSLNGARARGGHHQLGRAAGRGGEAGAAPTRASVVLAACLPAALAQAEAHARLGTAPPGVRAQASGVTPESGLYAVVQVARRARETPTKVVLSASPACVGPPPYALLCKRALLETVRAALARGYFFHFSAPSATRLRVWLTRDAQVLSRERSPFAWFMSCCTNRVWGGGDSRDTKYEAFATHVPPFDSHDAAARVIDAMSPRMLGALLCDELGWLDRSGALRREPDVLPSGVGGVASVSNGAQRFWAAVSASACGVPPPDARMPWPHVACVGWCLVHGAAGVPERVPPPCGPLNLWWPNATIGLLTPKKVRQERVLAADAAGARRVRCRLDAAALPDVLDPCLEGDSDVDWVFEESSESMLKMTLRGNNTFVYFLLRFWSSHKMYDISLFPPSLALCKAFLYKLVDFRGEHADVRGAGGGQVFGFSSAGSLINYADGWMRALSVRGTPVSDAVLPLVRELVNRTLPARFPVKVLRRPCNFLWDSREACERVCPGVTGWAVDPAVHRLDALQTCALDLVCSEAGRRIITLLGLRVGGVSIFRVPGIGWPVFELRLPLENKNKLEMFSTSKVTDSGACAALFKLLFVLGYFDCRWRGWAALCGRGGCVALRPEAGLLPVFCGFSDSLVPTGAPWSSEHARSAVGALYRCIGRSCHTTHGGHVAVASTAALLSYVRTGKVSLSDVELIGRLRGTWAPGSAEVWKYLRAGLASVLALLDLDLEPPPQQHPGVAGSPALTVLLDYSSDAFVRLLQSPDKAVRARALALQSMLQENDPRDPSWKDEDDSLRGPDGARR